MAVGLPLKTTYANGDVYSASDVNDTNGTINLLQTSTLSAQAGKNAVINGGFDIWQRGTSFVGTALNYTADRWMGVRFGFAAGQTMTRQNSGLIGIQYCSRIQRDSGNTGTGIMSYFYAMETADSYRFAGQTITMSFYARAGANFSSASSVLNLLFTTGTGTNEANGNQSGWTGAVQTSRNNTLTTSWQRFTQTFTIPSNVTQIGWVFGYTPVGTAGANDYYEITGCQLELGSYATTFSRAGGTIQGELAACQRYYQKSYSQSVVPGTSGGIGLIGSIAGSTDRLIGTRWVVVMRTAPTLTIYSDGGTSGKISTMAGVDAGGSVIGDQIADSGVRNIYTAVGITNGGLYTYHYTASSEL
jgi:hypothetical protein